MKAYKKLQKASIDFTLKCIRIIDFLQKENIDVIKLKKRLLLLAFFYQKVLACLQLLLLKKSSCLSPTPGLIPWRMGEKEGGGGGVWGGQGQTIPLGLHRYLTEREYRNWLVFSPSKGPGAGQSMPEHVQYCNRRRKKTEEKAKGIAAVLGDRIYSIPCRTSIFAPECFEESDEFILFVLHIVLV